MKRASRIARVRRPAPVRNRSNALGVSARGLGWSDAERKDWESFRTRVAAHAPRWRLLGVNYYPTPEVTWESPFQP